MSVAADKSFKMKMREVENAFKYRRIPYPKRSVELIALLAISCTFFLFMHTNKLNSRLKEMEVKLQPSELSALGLTGDNHIADSSQQKSDINTLQGTYQYLKSTGQRRPRSARVRPVDDSKNDNSVETKKRQQTHSEFRKHRHHQKANDDKQKSSEDVLDNNELSQKGDLSDEYDEYEGSKMYSKDSLLKAGLLNNTKRAEVDLVFFNRVPKVGSQALMELMVRLGKLNGFTHSRDKGKAHETILLKPLQQKQLVGQLLTMQKPHIYSQHIAYINFTRFHMPQPIYINLIRHPIDRIVSWHYYVRAPWYYRDMKAKLGNLAPKEPPKEFMEMDLDTCVRINDIHCQFNQMQILNPAGDHRRQTLFFCGQNRQLCMPFNSEAAMQKAKRTVEQDYAVVGTWEDTNITLAVLEHYIPKYFRHAKVAYYLGYDRLSTVNKNNVTHPISEETKQILSKNLTNEIEFYDFCKQRLYLQYAAISDGGRLDQDDYVLIPENTEDDNVEY